MDIVNSIANYSTSVSLYNVKQNVSISLLKQSMEQSQNNIEKLMEMLPLSPAPEGTNIDVTV